MENQSLSLCTEWSENEDFAEKEQFDYCVYMLTVMFLTWDPFPTGLGLISLTLNSVSDTVSFCDRYLPQNTTSDYLQCREDNGIALGYCRNALNESESQTFWECFDAVKDFQSTNPDTVFTKWRFYEVFCRGKEGLFMCTEYFFKKANAYNIDNGFLGTDAKTFFFAYILPAYGLVTVIFNGCIIFILTAHMSSNCNVLLLRTKALFDALTVATQLPIILCYITLRNSDDFLPYNICILIQLFMVFLPAIFHTLSMFVTMAMAFQKYLIISFPLKIKVYFKLKYIYIYITISIAITLITSLPNVIVFCNMQSMVVQSKNTYGEKFITMALLLPEASSNWMKKVDEVGISLRVLFLQCLPCFFLFLFEVVGIRRSRAYIKSTRNLHETRGTSASSANLTQVVYMSLANVTIFLVAELPNAVVLVYYAVSEFSSRNKRAETFDVLSTILNTITWLSSFCNLFVCIFFCRQFKSVFLDLIKCSKCKKKLNK